MLLSKYLVFGWVSGNGIEMYDNQLRDFKDTLTRFARIDKININPITYTLVGLIFGLLSIYSVFISNISFGLLFWVLNRLFDGLDGSTGRINERSSKLGAYLDLVFDFVIYSGIIVGFIYINLSDPGIIITGSVLLALYYINSIAWTYFEILGGSTAVNKPKFLIEGFETIIFYILFFIFNITKIA